MTKLGKIVDLTAVPAPNAAAAAQYYPAIYWYAMLDIPDQSLFSGPKRDENMPETITAQWEWLNTIKTTGCIACHGIGTLGTRTIPAALGHFASSADAWARRIQSGQAETNMVNTISRLDPQLAFKCFGDWTDRIAKGELPFAKPPRPQGVERNVVLTLWDWSRPTAYLHDLTPTDRRNPTVNANGKLYGTRGEHRLPAGSRSGAQFGRRDQASGARSEHADHEDRADDALALLGRATDLGQRERHAQLDDGREGPGVVHRPDPPRGQSGFLQAGIEPSLGASVPAAEIRSPALGVRPGERDVHVHRHLLPDAPSELRL
ncbi:MAG TPA: hypothetical protein VE993_02935 [Stellaceae bacterium]|nr:hypothetical protein [Stellaceae bacterium]